MYLKTKLDVLVSQKNIRKQPIPKTKAISIKHVDNLALNSENDLRLTDHAPGYLRSSPQVFEKKRQAK